VKPRAAPSRRRPSPRPTVPGAFVVPRGRFLCAAMTTDLCSGFDLKGSVEGFVFLFRTPRLPAGAVVGFCPGFSAPPGASWPGQVSPTAKCDLRPAQSRNAPGFPRFEITPWPSWPWGLGQAPPSQAKLAATAFSACGPHPKRAHCCGASCKRPARRPVPWLWSMPFPCPFRRTLVPLAPGKVTPGWQGDRRCLGHLPKPAFCAFAKQAA